jgi:hypothetical protein
VRGMHACGFPGNPGDLFISIAGSKPYNGKRLETDPEAASAAPGIRRSEIQVLRWYCQAKATKCGRMDEEESERFIVPQNRGNSSQETPWREGSADLWNRWRER